MLNKKDIKKHYNHKELLKKFNLVIFDKLYPGTVLWTQDGIFIKDILINIIRTLKQPYDYHEIQSPSFATLKLWKRTKHLDYYHDHMFFLNINDKDVDAKHMPSQLLDTFKSLKPMSCPFACIFFKHKLWYYHEIPLRISEFGSVFWKENWGVLNGFKRMYNFTQDDSHIFINYDQLRKELDMIIQLSLSFYKIFNMNVWAHISTKPNRYIGSDTLWEKSTNELKLALTWNNIKFDIHEHNGAFYGPKIDFSLGDEDWKWWQCGTIQLDFFLSNNWNLSYVDSNGKKIKNLIVIHHAIMGSIEWFIAMLLESYQTLPIFLWWKQVMFLIDDRIDKRDIYKIYSIFAKYWIWFFTLKFDVNDIKNFLIKVIKKYWLISCLITKDDVEKGLIAYWNLNGSVSKIKIDKFDSFIASKDNLIKLHKYFTDSKSGQ